MSLVELLVVEYSSRVSSSQSLSYTQRAMHQNLGQLQRGLCGSKCESQPCLKWFTQWRNGAIVWVRVAFL